MLPVMLPASASEPEIITVIVNTTESIDNNENTTTLREAIAKAAGDDRHEYLITFDPGIFTEGDSTITLGSPPQIPSDFTAENPLSSTARWEARSASP